MLVAWTLAAPALLALSMPRMPRIPQSPEEMMQRVISSVARAKEDGRLRQQVKVVIPDDQRTYKVFGAVEIKGTSAPEDLDPWPGGLKQQYPIALTLARQLLQGVTSASQDGVSDQVLDAEDACGLVLAQGATPSDDAACIVFLGSDQIKQLVDVDRMAQGRLLCLLNQQFRRVEDFSLWQRGSANEAYFSKGYETTYALEELACRGEDVKLVCEYGLGWRAFVFLEDDDTEGVPLHDGCLEERPTYKWLETQINEQHPQPRWARLVGEADQKGPRFMRGDSDREA